MVVVGRKEKTGEEEEEANGDETEDKEDVEEDAAAAAKELDNPDGLYLSDTDRLKPSLTPDPASNNVVGNRWVSGLIS